MQSLSDPPLYKTEDGNALRFFEHAIKNNFASENAGRSIFDRVHYVEVISPGQKESAPVLELVKFPHDGADPIRRENIIARFRKQYEAWLEGETSSDLIGTPITEWTQIDVALQQTLKHAGVHTVDGLAALPDSKLTVLGMGGHSLRERAKAFIASASGGAALSEMAARVSRLEQDNARLEAALKDVTPTEALENENAELRKQVASLQSKLEMYTEKPPTSGSTSKKTVNV